VESEAFAAALARTPGVGLTFISLNVFHWPQAGHLPIHLGDSCPQLEQTYAVLSFAMMATKVQLFEE